MEHEVKVLWIPSRDDTIVFHIMVDCKTVHHRIVDGRNFDKTMELFNSMAKIVASAIEATGTSVALV